MAVASPRDVRVSRGGVFSYLDTPSDTGVNPYGGGRTYCGQWHLYENRPASGYAHNCYKYGVDASGPWVATATNQPAPCYA